MIVSAGAFLLALVIHSFFISTLLIIGAILFDVVIYNLSQEEESAPPQAEPQPRPEPQPKPEPQPLPQPQPRPRPLPRPRSKTIVCDFTEGSPVRTKRPIKKG